MHPTVLIKKSQMVRHVQKALKFSLRERIATLVMGDIILLIVSAFVALWGWTIYMRFEFTTEIISANSDLFWLILPFLAVFVLTDSYHLKNMRNFMRSIKQPLRAAVIVCILYIMLYFFAPRNSLPRVVILLFGATSGISLVLWRILHFAIFSHHGLRQRIAIIRGEDPDRDLQMLLNANSLFYEVVEDIPVCNLKDIKNLDVDEVIYAVEESPSCDTLKILTEIRERGIHINFAPLFYERLSRRLPLKYTQGWYMTFLPLNHGEISGFYRVFKRMLDIFFAIIGLFLLMAMLPFIAIAIKLDNRGPIFYSQVRIGKNGKKFCVLKLRTMIVDADQKGAMWTENQDSRITRVGKYLRKTHIDEFPQFWNVLKGELSIVGVRPLSDTQCEKFAKEISFHNLRHLVKPGLTSWAIVNYKHVNNVEAAKRRLEYDLFYVKYQSVWIDFFIIFRTIWKIFTLKGM